MECVGSLSAARRSAHITALQPAGGRVILEYYRSQLASWPGPYVCRGNFELRPTRANSASTGHDEAGCPASCCWESERSGEWGLSNTAGNPVHSRAVRNYLVGYEAKDIAVIEDYGDSAQSAVPML
eukprot:scaffold360200_cov41-Prasinocladus_malaysianus.AAC.1